MNKIIIIFLISIFFANCQNCKLDKDSIINNVTPIIDNIATYAKKNGIPKSLNDIKNLPIKIEKCLDNNILECNYLDNRGYYFTIDNKNYGIELIYIPNKNNPQGFGLTIINKNSKCNYEIYFIDSGLVSDYNKPTCSLIDTCKSWGKQ